MKKTFIINFLVFLQYISCAMEDVKKGETDSYKRKLISATGEEIFYSDYLREYATFEDFKKEYAVKLLVDRFKMLYNSKKLSKDQFYQKECLEKCDLERNEIALMSNADGDLLKSIFSKTYDNKNIKIDHIEDVTKSLIQILPQHDENIKKFERFLEICLERRNVQGNNLSLFEGNKPNFTTTPKHLYFQRQVTDYWFLNQIFSKEMFPSSHSNIVEMCYFFQYPKDPSRSNKTVLKEKQEIAEIWGAGIEDNIKHITALRNDKLTDEERLNLLEEIDQYYTHDHQLIVLAQTFGSLPYNKLVEKLKSTGIEEEWWFTHSQGMHRSKLDKMAYTSGKLRHGRYDMLRKHFNKIIECYQKSCTAGITKRKAIKSQPEFTGMIPDVRPTLYTQDLLRPLLEKPAITVPQTPHAMILATTLKRISESFTRNQYSTHHILTIWISTIVLTKMTNYSELVGTLHPLMDDYTKLW